MIDYSYPLLRLLVVAGAFFAVHCHTSSSLTEEERAKLDPALQRLVVGEPLAVDQYTTTMRGDTTVYSVHITTDDSEALQDAGLPIGAVIGNTVTARLTVAQIREAAALSPVRSIENPSSAYPENTDN